MILRGALILTLALIELPVLAFLYDPMTINATDPRWLTAREWLREMVPAAIFFGVALGVLLTPQRRALLADWRSAAARRGWAPWTLANLIGFAVLAVATVAFNAYGASLSKPPWALFGLWSVGVIGLYVPLALALAPIPFFVRLIDREKWIFTLAGGAAGFVTGASVLSRQSWNFLSEATFQVSAFILSLYEKDVFVDPARRLLGADGFIVSIAAACSGYEGIGLVTVFLTIYLWVFRAALRFPGVYLILPAGIAAIWILNSVRIAALISLGAHASPEVAIAGFHSQAGWMMFLIVTIGIMLATHHIGFFRNETAHASDAVPAPAFREAMFLLTPFLAMTAAGIVAAAFTADGYWLYSLRVIAIGAALVAGWRFYRNLALPENLRAYAEPALIGAGVGIAWIASDPGRGEASDLGIWLAGMPAAMAAFWIVMRTIGTILLVPIAEELAFRGYLHRKLIADRFEAVAEGAFTWKAFVISSVLFAALHDRWLAGGLAGAAFALALYRSGKVSGAIIALMSANAVIAFWAIAFGQWSLL